MEGCPVVRCERLMLRWLGDVSGSSPEKRKRSGLTYWGQVSEGTGCEGRGLRVRLWRWSREGAREAGQSGGGRGNDAGAGRSDWCKNASARLQQG
jgi:hypothetical protein